eukprot:CAMPEP_0113935530 /NCGR_PEP_ID=MMETSP1339-20121228/2676_1 /TAXON_ID=94617 /ORGANISM="Fibrocapsa japonica" /LENGTH=542 /DNA_ID=CAMNT_0000937729 /DNA_START=284 /DNA_END=1912 /DNA_ORIENTATION=- /assembly_acc=CAM_ASM_000762
MLALMGPSGSGKTTLLDGLASRLGKGEILGDILINGKSRDDSFMRLCGYVSQEDSLMGVFTVRESLNFTASLVYPPSKKTERDQAVARTLKHMGLESAADTVVGDIFRKGLSGGQKRRLSIGLVLLTNPSLILLDEPTSGLDSASALGIVKRLKTLAGYGHTVICTIHQPSSQVFSMFDQLGLLSSGRTVYMGPNSSAVNYFRNAGHDCPTYANPADYFVGLINPDFKGHVDVEQLAQAFERSTELETIKADIDNAIKDHAQSEPLSVAKYQTSRLWQFLVLSKRNMENNVRNPGIYGVRLVMYLMLSFFIGFMFWDLGSGKGQADINSRTALNFYVAAFLIFMSIAVIPFFIEIRATFLRERLNGNYSVLPFALSNFVCSLPGIFLISLLSSILVVFPAGLNNFAIFLTTLFLSLVTAESLCNVISVLVPHYMIGIALTAAFYGFFMLCEGFMIVKSDIPPWFIWGHWMAIHTYSFRVFMYNEFHDIDSFDSADMPSGDAVLKIYDMENADIGMDLFALVVYTVLLQIIFACLLQFRSAKR